LFVVCCCARVNLFKSRQPAAILGTPQTRCLTMMLRASLRRLGGYCARPHTRQSPWPARSQYPLSTTSHQEPLTLSSDLTDSPIHVSVPSLSMSSLVHSSPAPFLFYPAFLSSDEQAVLLHACLCKLDASLSQSRDVGKRREAWQEGRNDAPYHGFLPDELYDFEEVKS